MSKKHVDGKSMLKRLIKVRCKLKKRVKGKSKSEKSVIYGTKCVTNRAEYKSATAHNRVLDRFHSNTKKMEKNACTHRR